MYIKVIKLIMFSTVINSILTPWELTITKYSGYALILLSYALPFLAIPKDNTQKVTTTGFLALALVLSSCISFFLSFQQYGIDFEFVKNWISLITMYWAIMAPRQEWGSRDIKHLYVINKLLSLVFVAYAYLPFSFRYTLANEWGHYAFTLNMGNTNGTALEIMFCIILLVMELHDTSRIKTKVINCAIIACLVYVLVLLRSRTVLLCSAIIIMMIFVRTIRVKTWHANVTVCISVLFVFIQFLFAQNDSIEIMGKSLASGRQNLFADYISQIQNDPASYIFGILCLHRLNNYHNAPFAVLMNLGIVGLVIYLAFWFLTLHRLIRAPQKTSVQNMAIVAILVYIIHSSTEAAPLIGMVRYGTPVLLLCRLAADKIVKDRNCYLIER